MNLLDRSLSFIAPHDCVACGTTGMILCEMCVQLLPILPSRCYKCQKPAVNFATCKSCLNGSALESVWVCTEYESIAKSLIHQLKFERVLEVSSIISKVMNVEFVEVLPNGIVVTPLPTATSRVRQRGYDQAALIAHDFARTAALPYRETLRRVGQQRQTGSDRKHRVKQMSNAFIVRSHIEGITHALLIDDVMTTGASLEAAAHTLKKGGVERVSALVFARAV